MNIFRKVKALRHYIKTIKEHEKTLLDDYNVRVDNIFRLYTVYNMDENEYNTYGGDKPLIHQDNTLEGMLTSESQSGKIINGEDLFKRQIDAEMRRLDNFLISIGLAEMYGCSQRKRVDKLNYLVVIEYKHMSTKFLANLAIITGIALVSSTIIGTILGLFLLF